jgi:hypothetical protein
VTATTSSAQGARTVGVTQHVRVTPDGDEMALSVYEHSAVICCEARLDRAHVAELVRVLVEWLAAPKAEPPPANWPPRKGDIWQDRGGRRWMCTGGSTMPFLECLAEQADDHADEINRAYGPMTLVSRPDVRDYGDEVPF